MSAMSMTYRITVPLLWINRSLNNTPTYDVYLLKTFEFAMPELLF